MSVTAANENARTGYIATGGEATFDFTFEVAASEDLAVELNGVLLASSHYTVSGVGVEDGGTITLSVSLYPTGATADDVWVLYRDMSMTRTTDYQTAGDFRAPTVNADFDRLWQAMQQVNRDIAYSIKFPISDSLATGDNLLPVVATRKGKYLYFDATTGLPSAASAIDTSAVAVSSFMETVIDDADAAAARNTLGILEITPAVTADGVTDNHAVIQAAVDAAIAAGGGRVLLPAGSIVVTQAIVHYGPAPVTIVGAGARATVLRAAASFDAVIKLEGTAYGTANIVGSAVTSVTVAYPGKYASAPTVTILGDGSSDPTASCTIDADGRIDSVTVNADGSSDHTEAYVAFGTSTIPSLRFVLEDLSISTTGTTGAVLIGKTAWQFFFSRCHFSSTAAVTLFDTYGDFGNIADCSFSVANASGVNFHIRGRMIDSSIHHCRFGNTCSGVKISTDYQSALVASSDRPQGITFTDCHMYSTGAYNLYASESLFLTFVGCWFTEGGTNQILMDNKATHYIFNSCYIGGSAGLTAVRIKKDVGNSVMFSSCFFNYSTIAILVEADADENLDTLHVVGCGFQNATVCCLDMDSVTHAVIIGNIDRGTPSAGSWNTRSTHGSSFGEYQFDNNAWHTVTPATFSTAAVYYWGRDTGIVMRNKGTYAATTTTSASQAHGMSRTPTWCQGTPTINTGAIWNSVKNATNIGFTWVTSGSPSLHWEAEV